MSLVFNEAQYSERDYARRVAAHIGTQHHEVMLEADEARAQAMDAVNRMDQPSVDGLNTYAICGAARRLGFRVALSGLGGDEFFGGYSTFHRTGHMAVLQYWAARLPWLSRIAGHVTSRLLARAPAPGSMSWQQHGSGLNLASFLEHSDFIAVNSHGSASLDPSLPKPKRWLIAA